MIDTVLLCGSSDDMNFDLNLSGEKKKASNRYFKQIENELKMFSKQKIPYIIIAGHYPVWAVGEHGPTYLLVQKLRPLLFKYKVTAYFSGIYILKMVNFLFIVNVHLMKDMNTTPSISQKKKVNLKRILL